MEPHPERQDQAGVLSVINVTTTLCITITLLCYLHLKSVWNYWPSRDLKGPKAWPIVGSVLPLFLMNRLKLDIEWTRKYGKVYGIHQGRKPVLVVADADVLRRIGIKDFDKFQNHFVPPTLNKYQGKFIFLLQDDHWKRVRSIMSPTFTSRKMRRMYKLLQVCGDDMIANFYEQIEANDNKRQKAVIDLKESFALFTMDAIATCCYGLKLERSGANDIKTVAVRNKFVKLGSDLFKLPWMRFFAAIVVSKRILEFFDFEIIPAHRMEPMVRYVENFIRVRRESGKPYDDYLQILLDAKLGDKMDLDELDTKENYHACTTSEELIGDHKRLIGQVQQANYESNGQVGNSNEESGKVRSTKIELSDEEILSNAMFLLMVGLETTGTLLTNCIYALSFHSEIQDKLFGEISKIANPSSCGSHEFDYEILTSCNYLDAVISETLRALPPVFSTDRVANADCLIDKYKVGVTTGMTIQMNLYAVMNDPDYWSEPEKFNPERFMPENRDKIYPGSYCPFGLGPRHCLGMRFSLTETKIGLAKMIMDFRFKPAPGTTYPPIPKRSTGLFSIKTPNVEVIRRNFN